MTNDIAVINQNMTLQYKYIAEILTRLPHLRQLVPVELGQGLTILVGDVELSWVSNDGGLDMPDSSIPMDTQVILVHIPTSYSNECSYCFT